VLGWARRVLVLRGALGRYRDDRTTWDTPRCDLPSVGMTERTTVRRPLTGGRYPLTASPERHRRQFGTDVPSAEACVIVDTWLMRLTAEHVRRGMMLGRNDASTAGHWNDSTGGT
jgi:hypothetical protein